MYLIYSQNEYFETISEGYSRLYTNINVVIDNEAAAITKLNCMHMDSSSINIVPAWWRRISK